MTDKSDQIKALVRAERWGVMPTATALIEASKKATHVRIEAKYQMSLADRDQDQAWNALDAALALTSLGELDREQVIVALMDES